MSRKDYERIAAALREAARLSAITTGDAKLADIAHNAHVECIATALAAENPRFDRERFAAASRA